jgi:hypothetical protein
MKVGETDVAVSGTDVLATTEFEPTWQDNLRVNVLPYVEPVKVWGKRALAVGGLAVASTAIVYPIAKQLALENTSVEADVISAPAEFSLTGNGFSNVQLGFPGTYYIPRSENKVGMSVEIKDLPALGVNDTQDLFSPQFQQILTNYFHDPEESAEGYADLLEEEAKERTLNYLMVGDLIVGTLVLGPLALRKDLRKHLQQHGVRTTIAAAGLTAAAALTSNAIADTRFETWANESPAPANAALTIDNLEGTDLEGTVASNQLLQTLTNEAVPGFKKNLARQEAATEEFVEAATASLLAQQGKMEGPREGEIAYMPLADTHGIQAMLRMDRILLDTYSELFGKNAIKFITISGDLTTNGTAAEKWMIRDLAELGEGSDSEGSDDDIPVVAIGGDHETPISISQMEELQMIIPNLKVEDVEEIRILGANDMAQKEFGGVTITHIDGITERELGERVREIADAEHPSIVLLHQGYAVMVFLKLDITTHTEMTEFLSNNGPGDKYLTEYRDDEIGNVPAAALYFGHWHEWAPVRVLWNENEDTGEITWTTVEQLDTSGGAIGNPTINRFSLPWYPPLQNAVLRVNFMNEESKLVTGYQLYAFKPDGTLVVSPRVEIGLPGGLPGAMPLKHEKPRLDSKKH